MFVEGNTGAMVELNCETDFVAKNRCQLPDNLFLFVAKKRKKLYGLIFPGKIRSLP
jgi:translation elongation factor EF-Ts